MNTNQAIKLALEAIKKQMHILAPEANMFLLGIADGPYMQRSAEKYKQFADAYALLESIKIKKVKP